MAFQASEAGLAALLRSDCSTVHEFSGMVGGQVSAQAFASCCSKNQMTRQLAA